MCGICGELAFGSDGPDPSGLEAMRRALAHRGPDDSGLLIDGRAGLAHARLSIIDLSPRGRQPLSSDDNSRTIVFNGEIYNYKAIRHELEGLGRTFSTGTDTEAAVTALAQWGKSALTRFIGMFAMAVHDRAAGSLLLARDRMGVKPLYWYKDETRLLFASEPRAILAHPAYTPGIDRQALASYLMCGYFPGEGTIFSGVRKLPPGTWLKVHATGGIETGRYWSLDGVRRGGFTGSFEEAVETLRPLLADAFALRMVSDVPVGMFLSGGVDSSLVAAVLKMDAGRDLGCFTMGFAEPGFDEAGNARMLADRLGLPITVRRVEPARAQDALANLPDVYDEPFGDASAIPTMLLTALAREQVKVALSADGGDELFCGYTGHVRYPSLFNGLRGVPRPARRMLAGLLRAAPLGVLSRWASRAGLFDWAGRAGQALPGRAGRMARVLSAGSPEELLAAYAARGFFQPEAARLCGVPDASLPPGFLALAHDLPPDEGSLTGVLMAHDARYWMPDDILVKVDRASMHVGLECRDPLIDHRIAEFAASLPLDYLRHSGRQKAILRRILSDLGLAELAGKPKRGFEIPLALWLAGPWKPFVDRHLSPARLREAGLVDPDEAGRVVRNFQTGRGESAQRVWLLLSLQMWAERWLGRGTA